MNNRVQDWRVQQVVFERPRIVGYMSIYGARDYHRDISRLKFITETPEDNVSWDLNHNIDSAVTRNYERNDERLDYILKFLLEHRSRFKFPPETFITYRNTYVTVIERAFVGSGIYPVCIRATIFKGHIYMFNVQSKEDLHYERNMDEMQKRMCAWGYKFHQYLQSDLPTLQPDITRPVQENDSFMLNFCSNIGEHKLFYAAQPDGLLAIDGKVPDPPETDDFNEIVDYLRKNNHFVELKTQKILSHAEPKLERNFRKHKLLECWSKCYLAGSKGLLIGFRDDEGTVKTIQWFETADIPRHCKQYWDPNTGLTFLNKFLNFVKESFRERINHGGDLIAPHNVQPILEFYINNQDFSVAEVQGQEKEILPDWFKNSF